MVDILLVGATGYSGTLITRYLAVHPERHSFSLALAARSKQKLRDLVSSLDISDSSSVETYVVDSANSASVDDLLRAARPRLVIAAVGPFTLYGLPLAHACAREGIHYVDITGEAQFVASLIKEVDYQATKTGAILIPCSGFDVVPFDILAYLSARTLAENLPADLSPSENVGVLESHTSWNGDAAGISGGSLATILTSMESPRPSRTHATNFNDFLSPIPAEQRKWQYSYTFPAASGIREWGFFSMFTPMNVALVQRTRGLFTLYGMKNDKSQDGDIIPVYSSKYMYTDAIRASSRLSAVLLGFGFFAGLVALALLPPLRWLVRCVGFKQGSGPSDEVLKKGKFTGRNISVSTDIPGRKKPLIVESTMTGKGDPYALTAVFVAESALALLGPRTSLTALGRVGGVLTPMSALGTTLIRRLSASGRCEFDSSVRE